ncbi:MAG TPA: BTAD domain-containing putative transcriptional regulator [Longimicrobiales bacterium]|nr:BTAD domain-containing putative transcriptional regulator [Longimicrobiales bacterium]
MIQLRLLGGVDLRGADGRELRPILAQPKRLALLAYLAVAGPRGFHRRDTLLGLFWPELDDSHARGALSRAVYYLRRQLGPDVLVGRGDGELGLDAGRLRCDAAAFDDALREGRDADALELYRGDLLQGFFLSDELEFERWLDAERARLRRAAAEAAWRLAAAAEAARDQPAAARHARRAVELSGDDEPAVRRWMELLARAGDRAGALDAYAALAARLREAYDTDPSPETRRLADALRADGPVLAGPASPAPPANGAFAGRVPRAGGEASAGPVSGAPDAGPSQLPLPLEASPSAPVSPSAPAPPFAPASPSAPAPAPPPPSRRRLAPPLALAAALVVAGGAWLLWPRPDVRARGADRVAVLPFRVSSADPSLGLFREGMVDLLSSKLVVTSGHQAVDAQTVVAAWRRSVGDMRDLTKEEALGVAAAVGAGKAVLGQVVGGGPGRVVLNAALYSVPEGRPQADASVAGPADSLPALVDRLAAQLLLRDAGEEEHRIVALTGTPLPALRRYLEARWAYRRGRYVEAIRDFRQALDVDSTFALSALGLASAGTWGHSVAGDPALGGAAWRLRSRLAGRDTLALRAVLGPRYPAPTPAPELLAVREAAAAAFPESPELWFFLGDLLLHEGALAGLDDWQQRAAGAFARSVRLDPGFAAPLQHLIELAALRGDTASVRQLAGAFLRYDPAADAADYVRWLVAHALRDSAAAATLRARIPAMSAFNRDRIRVAGSVVGLARADARLAGASLRRDAATTAERTSALLALDNLALDAGRPAEARAYLDAITDTAGVNLLDVRLGDALFWGGDAAAAATAAAALARIPAFAASQTGRYEEARGRCALQHWRLAHADTAGVRAVAARLRALAASDDATPGPGLAALCAGALEAGLAVRERRADARAAVARLDSLSRRSTAPTFARLRANLVAAGLWERLGDVPSARAALDRWAPPLYRSTFLREQGRLAALAGDAAAARVAYRQYLALRADPEPASRAEVERVRAELARLSEGR